MSDGRISPDHRPASPAAADVFNRALERADISTGDVTLHTLRRTALGRMIAPGYDDYTVMAISAHSSTRMAARPRIRRKHGRSARSICRAWAESGQHRTTPHPRTRTRRRK
jgi:Phage integrase family